MRKSWGGGGYLASEISSITTNFEQDNQQNQHHNYRFLQFGQNCKSAEICNKKPQNNNNLQCKNITYIIKNSKNIKICNKNLKVHKKYGKLNNKNGAKIYEKAFRAKEYISCVNDFTNKNLLPLDLYVAENNEKVFKNKCIKNTINNQTKINNKINLVDKNKLNNITKEKDTFKNNVLLAKLCEQKVEEKTSLKLSEEYIKMNNNFNKVDKNSCSNIINNNGVNTDKDNYLYKGANKNICASVENGEGIFFSRLNNKTDSTKLNKRHWGLNEVNSVGGTHNKKGDTLYTVNNYTRGNIKSVPKHITTAIICMWLFVLCACLALVVGVGYSNAKNNNLNVLPNTTTAEGSTFSGGDGTESNPYQIANYTDLKALSTTCNAGEHYTGKYFVLTDDIAISADALDSANSASSTYWVPIGCDMTGQSASNYYFSGHFNGQGHKILINGNITQNFGISTSLGGTVYGGVLFGYVSNGSVHNVNVVFNTSTDCTITFVAVSSDNNVWLYWGIITGCASSSVFTGCAISGSSVVITEGENTSMGAYSTYCGGVVAFITGDGSVVIDCEFNTNLTNHVSCYAYSAIVGCVNVAIAISDCKFTGNFMTDSECRFAGAICGGSDNSFSLTYAATVSNCIVFGVFDCAIGGGTTFSSWGVVVGSANEVTDCCVEGTINMQCGDNKGISYYMGIVAGRATTVANCYAKIDSAMYRVSAFDGVDCGLVAGQATTIENCYVEANMVKFYCYDVDNETNAGLVVGEATTINNCFINATISEVDAGASTSKPFKYIAGSGTANNCIIIADISTISSYYNETLTGYNCVVIGGITESRDTTNGLYVLSSDNENLSELKKAATYSGTGANGFTWNTTDGTVWDFTNTWTILNEGESYPVLKLFFNTITINVTIPTSSTNVGKVGQYIIYKLDDNKSNTNSYVVTNGSVITFINECKSQFTIMINYKLYMTTTIDGVSATQKTYTPTADTTINITITAPSGVNNWIVI